MRSGQPAAYDRAILVKPHVGNRTPIVQLIQTFNRGWSHRDGQRRATIILVSQVVKHHHAIPDMPNKAVEAICVRSFLTHLKPHFLRWADEHRRKQL